MRLRGRPGVSNNLSLTGVINLLCSGRLSSDTSRRIEDKTSSTSAFVTGSDMLYFSTLSSTTG